MDLFQLSVSPSVFSLRKLAYCPTDIYRVDLGRYFSKDKAKQYFLLGMLSRNYISAVNNLVPRDDISPAQIKQHLFDVVFKAIPQNSASITEHDEPSVKPS